jgi:hypothetical protein
MTSHQHHRAKRGHRRGRWCRRARHRHDHVWQRHQLRKRSLLKAINLHAGVTLVIEGDGHTLSGNGTQRQIAANQSVASIGPNWRIDTIGDYNHDAHADVLLRNDNGQVVMWEMNGAQIVSNHEVVAQGGQPAKVGLDWTVLSHHYDLV